MPRVRLQWHAALQRLFRCPAAPDAAALRLLRRTDGLAGRALSRMLRPPARLRVGPRRRSVRERCPPARGGLEGARPAQPRQGGRRRRRRAAAAAGRRGRRLRPGRRCAPSPTRLPPGRAACARARVCVGPALPRRPPPQRPFATAARPRARRTAPERPPRLRLAAGQRSARSHRRRLHHRSHRRCSRSCASPRRSRTGRHCDVCPHDSRTGIRVRPRVIDTRPRRRACNSTSRARTSR
jgi:hypothetical protein